MESFFDREVKRLEFVGERQQLRNQQKKEIDAALVAKEQVCSYHNTGVAIFKTHVYTFKHN